MSQIVSPTVRRGAKIGRAAFIAGAAMLALAGCANKVAKELDADSRKLVGMSKTQLISCAGRPDKALQTGTGETLTYSIGIPVRGGGRIGIGAGGGSRSGVGIGVGVTAPLGPGFSQSYCEAVFRVSGGTVTDVTFNASSSVRGSGQRVCYEIIGSCVN